MLAATQTGLSGPIATGAFDKFSNQMHGHIDNGVFLDGRDETLEETGIRSAWKGRETEEIEKPKRAAKSSESNKVERLKRAAKGTKSIKTWV